MNFVDITPRTIARIQRKLRRLLGEDFFQNEIDPYTANAPTLRDSFRKEVRAHPLASIWKSFSYDIDRTEKENILYLGDGSKECLYLWLYLNTIKHIPNFDRLLNRLKQRDHYYSTVFEARVIGEYHNDGNQIEIIDEANQQNKNADFIISNLKQAIYIECKSLTSTSRKEQVYWNELYSRVLSLLEKMNLCWNIEIYCKKELEAVDVTSIYNEIKASVIQENYLDSIIANENVVIRKRKIKDESIGRFIDFNTINTDETGLSGSYSFDDMALAKYSRDMMNLSEGSARIGGSLLITPFKIETRGVPVFLNPRRVGIYPHYNFDISERIISAIKAASRQIPHDQVGIVHIEIPRDITSNILKVIDSCYDRIHSQITHNHSRINSVVLNGLHYERNHQNLGVSINYTINNSAPGKPILTPFKTLGTTNIVDNFPGREGTMVLQAVIDPSWDPLSTQLFHDLSSHDNKSRLSIYICDGNKFRIDLTSSEIGRRVMTSNELINIPRGLPITIASSWTTESLQLRIFNHLNEKIVDQKEKW